MPTAVMIKDICGKGQTYQLVQGELLPNQGSQVPCSCRENAKATSSNW